MKNSSTAFFLLFLVNLFLLPTQASAQEGYSIKGKVRGWHDTVCYLGNHYGDKQYVKDTTKIDKGGNFIFKGTEKLPGGIYIVVLPNKVYLEILVDKEQHFSFEADTADLIAGLKFKNSEDNNLFYNYRTFLDKKFKEKDPLSKHVARIRKDSLLTAEAKMDSTKKIQEQMIVIDKQVQAYQSDFIKKHPESFVATLLKAQTEIVVPEAPLLPNGKKDSLFPYHYYKNHYWDNISLADDRLLRTPIFHMKLKQFFEKVVVQHPDSIIKEADILVEKTKGNKEMFKYLIWYVTLTYETSPIMGMDAVFVHQVENYYMTKKAYWVDSIQIQKIIHRGLTLKPLLLGKPAPPIIMQDSVDKNVSLYDVKAKYTVLVFWDPDCGHCQKVIPKLNEIYESSLKAKGIEVYSVDIEDDAEKWKKFLIEKKIHLINTRDKYKQYPLRQLYDIYSTPVIYLLDEDKKIRAKRIDVEQLDEYITYLEKVKKMENEKRKQ